MMPITMLKFCFSLEIPLSQKLIKHLVISALNMTNIPKECDPTIEEKFGCVPMRFVFFMECSAGIKYKIEEIEGFISSRDYPGQDGVKPQEFGAVGNVRFVSNAFLEPNEYVFDVVKIETITSKNAPG